MAVVSIGSQAPVGTIGVLSYQDQTIEEDVEYEGEVNATNCTMKNISAKVITLLNSRAGTADAADCLSVTCEDEPTNKQQSDIRRGSAGNHMFLKNVKGVGFSSKGTAQVENCIISNISAVGTFTLQHSNVRNVEFTVVLGKENILDLTGTTVKTRVCIKNQDKGPTMVCNKVSYNNPSPTGMPIELAQLMGQQDAQMRSQFQSSGQHVELCDGKLVLVSQSENTTVCVKGAVASTQIRNNTNWELTSSS